MERMVIFGAGGTGGRYSKELLKKGQDKIVAFLDNSKAKQGTQLNGIDIFAPEKINELDYTVVVVAPGFEPDMVAQLKLIGVPEAKIQVHKSDGQTAIATRNIWLSDYAKTVYARGLIGNVAEAGVFRGDFAKRINAEFPDRTLYLLDTFEGFPESDVANEPTASNSKAGYYAETSEQLVLSKLPNPQKVIIKKGYFPDTAQGINDTFCFVNLDLDLYKPTLEGLKYFYPKMEMGGWF